MLWSNPKRASIQFTTDKISPAQTAEWFSAVINQRQKQFREIQHYKRIIVFIIFATDNFYYADNVAKKHNETFIYVTVLLFSNSNSDQDLKPKNAGIHNDGFS